MNAPPPSPSSSGLDYWLRFAGGAVQASSQLAVSILHRPRLTREKGAVIRRRVVFFSFVEWHGARQRPHHLAERFPENWDVTFVSALRLHHAAAGLGKGSEPRRPGMQIVTPRTFPGERRIGAIHWANDRLLLDSALRAMHGKTPEVVVVNSPALARPALNMPKRVLVFDLMDEFTREGPAAERYRRDESRLLEAADLTFTGTQSLFDDRQGRHNRLEFLPGGCDYAHFASGDPAKAPLGIDQIRRPIVGFFGALNDRLDGALLERLAAEQGWSLVLVGPSYRSAPSLPSGPNVFMPGHCPYDQLPHVLAAFDVAIIPYRASGDTLMVNPVKVLEYMAGGKPVVSTALPDVESLYSESALIARDTEEFIALVRRALNEPSTLAPRIEAGRKLAQGRSWEQAATRMAGCIEQRLREIESKGGSQ